MSRIGVLGGTFDPLHLGHLRAAEAVRDVLALDRVLFVPAATPPHKATAKVTDAEHRLRMVERALAGERHFEVSRVEIERAGPSYTIDTLAALASEFGAGCRIFFITGTDAFSEIRTWRSWRELLTRYSFAVHERPGWPMTRAREALPGDLRQRVVAESELADGADETETPRVFLVQRPMLDVSSTEIRRSVAVGRSIRFLVPDAVEAYIRERRLYQLGWEEV